MSGLPADTGVCEPFVGNIRTITATLEWGHEAAVRRATMKDPWSWWVFVHADDVGRISITRIVPRYSWVVVSADDYFEQVQNRIDLRERSDNPPTSEDVLWAWKEAAIPFLMD
jgi:hypothetical protein